jgi:putative addiction module component (TIGR02574 family)
MALSTRDIEEAILHLPIRDRARLAQKLLESLDQLSDDELKQVWLQEARRRAEEIDQGKVELVSAEELEQQVEALFK